MGKDKPPKYPNKPTKNVGYASVDINGNVTYHNNEKDYFSWCRWSRKILYRYY